LDESLDGFLLNNLEIQMKKSLLALAVLGAFAGAASAQSSVTLYGRIDAGYQWNEAPSQGQIGAGVRFPGTNNVCVPTGTATTCTAIDQESYSGIEGGYMAGNRWGIRGSEALGGGMSAIFTLESGFDISTGTSQQGNRLFGRQAWLGLATPYGTVAAGRIPTFSSGTGSFDMFSAIDPFSTGWGINSLGTTFISANALRPDNVLLYVTPTWAGFKGGAAYSFNYNGQEQAPSSKNTEVSSLGASYSWGPLYAAVTYDVIEYATQQASGAPVATASTGDQKHLQIGLTWDFKVAKLYGAYADQTKIQAVLAGNGSDVVVPTGIGNYDNTAWMLGATVPFGAFTFRASYQYSDADQIVRSGVKFEPDYDSFGLGVDYKLSNRTLVYLGYGNRSADGTLLSNTFDRQQFAFGLNHSF
jgi:predicted porin